MGQIPGARASASRSRSSEATSGQTGSQPEHIAVNCGVGVTGDILRHFGNYICRIEARNHAEMEARQAKEEGRLPN